MEEKIYNAISDRFFGISYGFLMPVFFASLAFHLHLDWSWNFVVFAVVLTLVAIFGKFVGSWGGAKVFGHSNRESTIIGFGMNGRGAVELVVAAVVIELSNELLGSGVIEKPLLTQEQFSGLVLMAFVTTLITPILLKRLIVRSCSGDEQESFCELWEESSRNKLR